MTRPARRAETIPGAASLVAGIVVNTSMLLVVHQHGVWRPWLGGVVTDAWAEVLWAVDLSLIAQIVGSALLLAWRPHWFYHLIEGAKAVATGLSLAVCIAVFPFDFSGVFGGVDRAARVVMTISLFAVGLAVLVHLAKLVASPWTHAGESHA